MKKFFLSSWKKMELDKKFGTIGAIMLLIALFLPWYSDIDVFRSGDVFSGLGGPTYLLGFSIMAICVFNLINNFAGDFFLKGENKISYEKIQIFSGFSSLFILLIVNSIYFHPSFGLNILSKKNEFGMIIALFGAALICFGSLINYFSKGKEKSTIKTQENEKTTQETNTKISLSNPQFDYEQSRVTGQPLNKVLRHTQNRYPEKASDAYAQMKKLMEKDTLSVTQRQKVGSTEIKNAFLGNSPTEKFVPTSPNQAKKNSSDLENKQSPQPFRIDL